MIINFGRDIKFSSSSPNVVIILKEIGLSKVLALKLILPYVQNPLIFQGKIDFCLDDGILV